jgi:hypothetical protein
VKPHSNIPPDSVIMIGSFSHLGGRGLESYTGDMVRVLSFVAARVGDAGEGNPLCPHSVGEGVLSRAELRALLDRNEEGLPTAAERATAGSCHIVGSLAPLPRPPS